MANIQAPFKNIIIDNSLENYKNNIYSVFEAIKKIPTQNFFFFFSNKDKSNLFFQELNKIFVANKLLSETNNDSIIVLKNFLADSSTSFSWGLQEFEFIFIILTDLDKHFLDQPTALIGLLIHEIMHGIERQRGLEDDLKRSLAITIQTFYDLADLVSKEYIKDDIITLFKNIGEIAVYTLKDLYVNREALERGFATEILEQYKSLFYLNDSDGAILPPIELELTEIDKTKHHDLKEFEKAFITILGLVPAWLPFVKISHGFEKDQALEIRAFIDKTYSQVSVISERFRHLENVYLNEFSYSPNFHKIWFTEVFSIVIDLLSGGEFIIWQFSQLVIKLEKISDKLNSNDFFNEFSLEDLILTPVLKSAYIFSKQKSSLDIVNKEIFDKLATNLDKEELIEWEQDYEEYFIEELLLFALGELIRILRKEFLDNITNIRLYTGLILDILQILIDIKEDIQFLNEYHIIKNSIHQFIIDRDSRFLSLKILYPLEFTID